MKQGRQKYKVRLQRGRNAMRRIWKRTERNNRKWKKKKTVMRVRKGHRKVKRRRTGTNRRTNRGRERGDRAPRTGKRTKWLMKKRKARKARKRRYGAGTKPKRRGAMVRNKKHKNQVGLRTRENRYRKGAGYLPRKGYDRPATAIEGRWDGNEGKVGTLEEAIEVGLDTLGGRALRGSVRSQLPMREPRREQRKKPRDHVRGRVERSAEIRRWRAGRAKTRGEARKRREGGQVRRVGAGKATQGEERTEGMRGLVPGEGRKRKEARWKGKKLERRRSEFGRGVRKWNGRTGRGYVRVDYRIGVRRVTRRPRTGEVRRPARMERGRWMRTKG